jgi:hypothetical protein
LGIHEVGDGNRVPALDLGRLVVEHDLGTASRADAHVLLAELLDVGLDARTLLDERGGVSVIALG